VDGAVVENDPARGAGPVRREEVVDLSLRMNAEGKLAWSPPPGAWIVYRFGHTTMGSVNQPAQWQATGLECDKMSAEAVGFHMEYVITEIRSHLGDLLGTGFTHVHFDSHEAGLPSWTPRMREEFAARLRSHAVSRDAGEANLRQRSRDQEISRRFR
jgi:alpha-L-rhamnosidase